MEKINTLKPSYKIMNVVLNQCLRLNGGKAMFIVLLYSLVQGLIYGLSTTPLLGSISKGTVANSGLVFCLVFFLVALTLEFVLNYGKLVVFSRYVEKSQAQVKHLFCGFSDRSGKIFAASFLLAVLNFVFSALLIFGTWNFFSGHGNISMEMILSATTQEDFEHIFTVVTWMSAIVLLGMNLVRIPFAYLWLVLYRRPDLNVFNAMGIAVKLLFKQFFHLVGFVIRAVGIDLVLLIVVALVSAFVPTGEQSIFGALFLNVLSFIQLIQQFKVLTRANFAVPIYFYSMTGVLEIHKSDYEGPVSEEIEKIVERKTELNDEVDSFGHDLADGDEPVDDGNGPDENLETADSADDGTAGDLK